MKILCDSCNKEFTSHDEIVCPDCTEDISEDDPVDNVVDLEDE